MEETNVSLFVEQKVFQEEPHSTISPEICSKQNQAHVIAREKTLQYRLGLFRRTFQIKIKHTSFKANRTFCVRSKGRQY